MRQRPAATVLTWRPRNQSRLDELEDVTCHYGGWHRGADRCRAVGLEHNDCSQERWPRSAYCYYHRKLAERLTEPNTPQYPVWPLPAGGYVLVEEVVA